MYGFTHVKTNGVHFFTHNKLSFVLKYNERTGQTSFCLTDGRGKVVNAPKSSQLILGQPYQPDTPILGYASEFAYINAVHELVHMWYSWHTANQFSPNHLMLLGIQNIPIAQADHEENIITGLQVFHNNGEVHQNMVDSIKVNLGRIKPKDNLFIEDILIASRDFQDWVIGRITS